MSSPSTNLIFLPFSHLTCDLHDVKRFLFRATSPKSWASNFYSGVNGAISGVKNKKLKQKSVCCLHFFWNLSNNSTNLLAYRGYNLAILYRKILINCWKWEKGDVLKISPIFRKWIFFNFFVVLVLWRSRIFLLCILSPIWRGRLPGVY